MHIIHDIKNKIASELAGFGFWQLNLAAQPVNRSTAQNDLSNFRTGWWQFCWIIGVKFNSIQSIIVWLLHITQFTVCAIKNLTILTFCCRFTTMSRVIEHDCHMASPAWAVNMENLFYWNTTTGNNSSNEVFLLRWNVKTKCKEYFSYPMLECRSVNRPKDVVRWYDEFPWLHNHLPHMPAHSRQSRRKNIIARMHTW